jgi:signal transduction histidine kinase
MRELHRLLGALRDDGGGSLDLEPAGEGGLRPGIGDIDQLAELTRRSGLVVQVHRSGDKVELDPSVRLAGYRVAQESLANAMKHAGRGAVVDIFKSWHPDHLHLQVRSRGGHDGTRPGTPGSGNGLVGLRERVELVGGTFESGWVGEEFVTTAVLPLTAPTRSPAPATVPAERSRRTDIGRPSHIRPVSGSSDGAA